MKITAVSVTNFKRIDSIEITPDADRALVLIAGKNGNGKTSLMDALSAAIGGKDAAPTDPIRHGTESAEIRVELDGGALVVKRTFEKDGASKLELRDADGKLASPQARLDKLRGSRFLDPLAFLHLSPGDQRKALLALIDKEGKIAALDDRRKRVFDRRTDVNRDHKKAEAQLAGMPIVPPTSMVSVADVLAEVKALEQAARAKDAAEHAVTFARQALTASEREKLRIDTEIEALVAKLEAVEARMVLEQERVTNAVAALLAAPPPDEVRREHLQAQLRDASEQNRRAAAQEADAKRRAELVFEVEHLAAGAETLTAEIEKIDADKAGILAAAALPVNGLDVGPDGVRFNDVPLDQASGAEQLRVALALAIAASPNLRDVWVRDGSLLDDDSLGLLAKEAEAAGVRCWVERVGDRDPGAIVIQDGKVRQEPKRKAS